MKKLLPLLLLLISFTSFSQEEKRFDLSHLESQDFKEAMKIAAIKARDETNALPEIIAFEQKFHQDLSDFARKVLDPLQEDSEFTEISVNASVIEIFNGSALVVSRDFAKHFKVNTAALQKGWEYYFRLRINVDEKKKMHCSGCTGVLDAEIVGYSISPLQAKRNILRIHQENEGTGYDRSPRHH